MKELSVYIHIPFCEQKCNYCAFVSFCASQKKIDEYISLLCKEIFRKKSARPVKTVYIGGGTPSILSEAQIEKIFCNLFENFNILPDAEITIEANPNSITEQKLAKWKALGINRLSVGVQSLSDESLKKIGRLHDKKTALEKLKLAKKYFENISADLIVGLEGERGKDLCAHAKSLLSVGIKHISCYLLEIYENTKIFEMIKSGRYLPLDDEKTIDAFEKLSNFLEKNAVERYEISNFAFPGFESKHNLNYWARGEYLGLGMAAHSFVGGKRFFNSSEFDSYKNGVVESETLGKKVQIEEIIMLGLRSKIGVDLKILKKLGYNLSENENFRDYFSRGILVAENDIIKLNKKFYHVSNTIIANLIP